MVKVYIDIFLCLITYAIMIYLIVWRKNKANRPNNSHDDDDDGGIPVMNGPELDLPPGVCLPIDGPILKKEIDEEIFA